MGTDLPDRTLCAVSALCFMLIGLSAPGQVGIRDFFSLSNQVTLVIFIKPLSVWIRGLIRSALSDVRKEVTPLLTFICQARELRAMAISLAFHKHHSVRLVMDAASWSVVSTFASFYPRD